jgi:hypothetical protein
MGSSVLSGSGSVASEQSLGEQEEIANVPSEAEQQEEVVDSDEEEENLLAQMKKEYEEKMKLLQDKKQDKKKKEVEEKWILKSEAREKELKNQFPDYSDKTTAKQKKDNYDNLLKMYLALRDEKIDLEMKKHSEQRQAFNEENGFNPKKQFTINPNHSSGKTKIKPKKKISADKGHMFQHLEGMEEQEWSRYDPNLCMCRRYRGRGESAITVQCQKPALKSGYCQGCSNKYDKEGWWKDGSFGVYGSGFSGNPSGNEKHEVWRNTHPWNKGELVDKRDEIVKSRFVVV